MRVNQTAAAVVAGLAAILGVAGSAGVGDHPRPATSAPVLRPPVITEDFRPVLPCDPNTTVGMEGCGERRVLAADKQLNADIRVIFGLLYDAPSRRDFITAQTKWAAYRGADCQSQSDVYEGGTEQPVAFIDCAAADDTLRRQDLKAFYEAVAQGRAGKVPAFP